MNLIYKNNGTSKYTRQQDKTLTIGELKEIVGGDIDIMYLPIENAYLVYNAKHTELKQGFFNSTATEKLVTNYPDIKIRIYGTAFITDTL